MNNLVEKINKTPLINSKINTPSIMLKKPILKSPALVVAPPVAGESKPKIVLKAPLKLHGPLLKKAAAVTPEPEKKPNVLLTKPTMLGSEDSVDPVNGFDKDRKLPESKTEEVVIPEVKEETAVADIVEATAVEKEPVTDEEHPEKKHRRRRKKNQEQVVTTELENGETVEVKSAVATEDVQQKFVYSFPTTDMSFTDAANALKSSMHDEEWEAEKNRIIKTLSEVSISDDMTVGPISVAIAQLAHLRDEIWFPFCLSKGSHMRFSRKEPEGDLSRLRTLNSFGANELERKKNGIMACMNFKTPDDQNINLYEMADEFEERYNFYKEAMAHIQSKLDGLRILSFGLNTDSKMLPYQQG